MATSSITKNFVISGQKQVEMFADAIEASANDRTPRVPINVTYLQGADEIVKFQVHPTDPTKTASIGAQLNPDVDAALREFLRENWDIFAWHPSDMPGIPVLVQELS